MKPKKFTFEGPFGELLQKYQVKGKDAIRKLNPPTKERIANDPAFEKVRQNNVEFKGASTLSKFIRNPQWREWQYEFKDHTAHSRLTGLCKRMIAKMDGSPGKRPAAISLKPNFLQGFRLDKERSVLSNLNESDLVFQTDEERTRIILKAEFNKYFLPSALHKFQFIRLVMVVVAVSDLHYNAKTKEYEPLHPKENALAFATVSPVTPITEDNTPLELQLEWPLKQAPHDTTKLLVFLGTQFDNYGDDQFQASPKGKAMDLIKIY